MSFSEESEEGTRALENARPRTIIIISSSSGIIITAIAVVVVASLVEFLATKENETNGKHTQNELTKLCTVNKL